MPAPLNDSQINSTANRNHLFKAIWDIADQLRGAVDGWDFKQFVLGMILYRYLSENLASYINKIEQKRDASFNYAKLEDEQAKLAKEMLLEEKGFFIPPSGLFENVINNLEELEKAKKLNTTLNDIFKNIEASSLQSEAQESFKGLFADLDMNSDKLGSGLTEKNRNIARLLEGVASMQISNYQRSGIDVFGDAYEFLMGMYASSAGKSGGEFFTPPEVSELLAKLVIHKQKSINKVYDPCCGSGSLLLQFSKILGIEQIKQGFFGQEINQTTYNLCRANMLLHNIDYDKFHIAYGNTLIEPKLQDAEPFDAIVSNPPYSTSWIGDDDALLINDARFSPASVLAPKKKADLAFTLHMLSWLSYKGTAAIVQYPGVLYRGGAEAKIRSYLVDRNFIDAIIALPSDLFFGTNIATAIVVLKKSRGDDCVLFIDAKEEYTREGIKNKLGKSHIEKILKVYENREQIAHFSTLASIEQIKENGYNLSAERYVLAKENTEEIDINALNAEIANIVARQTQLRERLEALLGQLG
ncbi:type I restriction-modification system subunit M [Helicobacter suis]|uniref:type I restriction-modification system subunit M n=1 Tax=Helicobacter suis TaxID=104628 RepID=UPI0013D0F607|nr:type I restriction-modification system subunit M [Helicobacter suis]